jgi:ABC-type transport system substrate-binding protein
MNFPARFIKLSFLLCFVLIFLFGCTTNPPAVSGGKTLVPTREPTTASQPTQPKPTATAASAVQPTPTAAAESSLPSIKREVLLDPALAQDADSLQINSLLYEGLVRKAADGKFVPALAESWVVSDDQLDLIFTLRPGVVFSDGTPVTTDIVEANMNRWFDPQDPLHKGGQFGTWERLFLGFKGQKDAKGLPKSPVDGFQKVDQRTVLIHLNRPVSETELLEKLADPAFSILSIKALSAGSYGASQSPVVSSGPYIVESWTSESLKLAPNTKYWGDIPQEGITYSWK